MARTSPLITRWMVDPPADGRTNMATDEALLESAARDGRATVRIYRWSVPTLSLGYFQSLSERAEHPASRHCPVVRRRSGGGAIVHDVELTYSLAIPLAHLPSSHPAFLYKTVHQAWLDVIERVVGVRGRMVDCRDERSNKPFLCFQRRAAFDLLVRDHKILGSAQRRFRTTVLQHGSLLLERSAAAPELPGLAELVEKPSEIDALIENWRRELSEALALRLESAPLADEERHRVDYHLARFGSNVWTARRA